MGAGVGFFMGISCGHPPPPQQASGCHNPCSSFHYHLTHFLRSQVSLGLQGPQTTGQEV